LYQIDATDFQHCLRYLTRITLTRRIGTADRKD